MDNYINFDQANSILFSSTGRKKSKRRISCRDAYKVLIEIRKEFIFYNPNRNKLFVSSMECFDSPHWKYIGEL